MAFAARNLSVLSYANGFTLWHYATTDENTLVTGPNYFNPASDMLRVGDMIIANTGQGDFKVNTAYFVSEVKEGIVVINTH